MIGQSGSTFLENTPETVAQAVRSRLRLFTGEWGLDLTEGTDWKSSVLGERKLATADTIIQQRIAGTQGVSSITSYSSTFNGTTRKLSIVCAINTIYGATTVEAVL